MHRKVRFISTRSGTAVLTTQNRMLEQMSREAKDYKFVLQQLHPRTKGDDSKLIMSVLAKHATSNWHDQQE